MSGMILAAAILGVTGLIVSLLLGFAGLKFAVKTDERVEMVRELLPSNNCGGCGFAGCDAMAEAIVAGEAKPSACPSLSDANREKIADIMGEAAEAAERKVAFVRCGGTCDKASVKYNYYGLHDCKSLSTVPGGGPKACPQGCLGMGTCVEACKFDAIRIANGVALVDREKCVGCAQCAAACPRHVIEIVPYAASHAVRCSSTQKGKDVRAVCSVGCIGCGICAKQCEAGAITVEDNLARIDPAKCVGCGNCAKKCPAKAIHVA